ncbi:MAG: hypothetical protein JOS17DRAFT_269032 [Linnemannia elongata]|nr:MAG: hypothetical protein JOS17DRAFT_269032 [Linnemannia elongata]
MSARPKHTPASFLFHFLLNFLILLLIAITILLLISIASPSNSVSSPTTLVPPLLYVLPTLPTSFLPSSHQPSTTHMDPLSRLPVECLEHILRCIGTHSRAFIKTLARLRLVNKQFSLIAFPFLMEDLFRMSPYIHKPHGVPRFRDRVRSLLINNDTISVSDLHPALVLELELDNTSSTTYTTTTTTNKTTPGPDQFRVNLLRHIRNINLNKGTFSRHTTYGYLEQGQRSYSAEILNYIHSPEFMSSCSFTGVDPACSRHNDSKLLPLLLFPIVVYREAIWALAALTSTRWCR